MNMDKDFVKAWYFWQFINTQVTLRGVTIDPDCRDRWEEVMMTEARIHREAGRDFHWTVEEGLVNHLFGADEVPGSPAFRAMNERRYYD